MNYKIIFAGKRPFAMMAVTALLFGTGCVDIMHYFERSADQSIKVILRISVARVGKEKKKEGGANEALDIHKGLYDLRDWGITPAHANIEGEFASAIETTFTVKDVSVFAKKTPGRELPIVPYMDRHGQFVFVYENKHTKNDKKTKDMEMIAAMLSSTRYTMVFGGSFRPVKAVIIDGNDLAAKDLIRYRMGPLDFIEVPLFMLLTRDSAVIISFTNDIRTDDAMSALKKRHDQRKAEKEKRDKEEKAKKAT